MGRIYFGRVKMAKRVKFCMSCKTTQTDHPSCICQECRDKRCINCGKISVYNTQYNDIGKPFCPKCFRTVITLAVQSGKVDSFTLHQRLDAIESDIAMLKRIITGAGIPGVLKPRQDISSKIDSLLDTMEIPDSPSVDDIKNKALSLMMESEPDTETDKD
jgi:hypothetical protein